MFDSFNHGLRKLASSKSVGDLLLYGFLIRLIALLYSVIHDYHIDHIKYTDIDYHVFTNGSRAILDGRSPYEDIEYRYPPLVALIFAPNVLLNQNLGKFVLIVADIVGGYIQYRLNIYQGTHRSNSKLFLILWLFNPVTIAISTRGSFEPIITLLVLACVYLMIDNRYVISGLLYGLTIHIKLYPIIYALSFYGYIINKKPFIRTQSKISYWIKTISPTQDHFIFFISTCFSILLTGYVSYRYYGQEYLEQSLFYHMKRKDIQHNFSAYFYLFKLFPRHQDELSIIAFVIQFLGVLKLSISYFSFDTNRRTKLRKLTFSLFTSTFLFVSLNKVCTSQYFNWYLIFLPLVLDSLKLEIKKSYLILAAWISSQAIWLFFAYLYEYQGYDLLNYVGNSSILFMISNLWILGTLCCSFDATTRLQTREDTREL